MDLEKEISGLRDKISDNYIKHELLAAEVKGMSKDLQVVVEEVSKHHDEIVRNRAAQVTRNSFYSFLQNYGFKIIMFIAGAAVIFYEIKDLVK